MLKAAVRVGDYKLKGWRGVRVATMLLVTFADQTELPGLWVMFLIAQPKWNNLTVRKKPCMQHWSRLPPYYVSVVALQTLKVNVISAKHLTLRAEECLGQIKKSFISESLLKNNNKQAHPRDSLTPLFASRGSWQSGPVNIFTHFLSWENKAKQNNLAFNPSIPSQND